MNVKKISGSCWWVAETHQGPSLVSFFAFLDLDVPSQQLHGPEVMLIPAENFIRFVFFASWLR